MALDFISFLEHLLVELFCPNAYTWFGLEPSSHTRVQAGKNSRIYAPTGCQMHQHSPSARKMWLSFSCILTDLILSEYGHLLL